MVAPVPNALNGLAELVDPDGGDHADRGGDEDFGRRRGDKVAAHGDVDGEGHEWKEGTDGDARRGMATYICTDEVR